MNICLCGCGNECNKRYVIGHNNRGIKRSREAINKMIKTMSLPGMKEKQGLGVKLTWTDEKKQKMSEFNRGKVLSEEHKFKIGKGNNGKIRTEDVKKKIQTTILKKFYGDDYEIWLGCKRSNRNRRVWTTDYKKWRKLILIRDNFKCQYCDSTERLEVHHLKQFHDNIEIRHDINNGITLCHNCHKKTDSYGMNKIKLNKLLTA